MTANGSNLGLKTFVSLQRPLGCMRWVGDPFVPLGLPTSASYNRAAKADGVTVSAASAMPLV